MSQFRGVAALIAVLSTLLVSTSAVSAQDEVDYEKARWHPLHFKPAIDSAKDEQCLACHQAVLERRVRETSPAGVTASDSLAWYQTLGTYSGEQETFHRRHLATDYAQQVMQLRCNIGTDEFYQA